MRSLFGCPLLFPGGSFCVPAHLPALPAHRGVKIHGFWLNPYLMSQPVEKRQETLREVMRLLEEGVIKPYSGALSCSCADASAAHLWAGTAASRALAGAAATEPAAEQSVSCPTGNRYPLEEVREAIRETNSPKRGGKCFLEG